MVINAMNAQIVQRDIKSPVFRAKRKVNMENNRVLAAIQKTRTQIAERLAKGIVTQQKVDDLNKVLDMDLLEYVKFQELKSFAFASDKLSLDEANTIYGYLGNIPDTFNNQPIEVKSVLTRIFKELLGWKISFAK
jgi:hypothetical protein